MRPETEFFTGLPIANKGNRLCQPTTWPEEAADYLFTKVHEKPIPDYYDVTPMRLFPTSSEENDLVPQSWKA